MYDEYDSTRFPLRFFPSPAFLGAFAAFFAGVLPIVKIYSGSGLLRYPSIFEIMKLIDGCDAYRGGAYDFALVIAPI